MTSTTPRDQSTAERLRAEHGPALTLGDDCDLPDDLVIEIDPGAHLRIGDRVSIRRGTTIQAHRGATVAIGNDVAVGEHTFISAMAGIRIGDGAALSNMVDLHDHNHRPRTAAHVPTGQLVPWASGFEAAPIIIEPGATLSTKVTVTAGVRIGANALVGANAVVSRSIAPDTVATGVPAGARRTFDGAPVPREDHRTLTVGFFGTSIMEHLEAVNAQMTTQAASMPARTTPRAQCTATAAPARAGSPHLACSTKPPTISESTSPDRGRSATPPATSTPAAEQEPARHPSAPDRSATHPQTRSARRPPRSSAKCCVTTTSTPAPQGPRPSPGCPTS